MKYANRNGLKATEMTYEDRVNNLETKRKKNRDHTGLAPSKLFPEGDTSLENSLELFSHGMQAKKNGRPLMYDNVDMFNNQIYDFVKYCSENNIVPTRPGLALWLGTTSCQISRWKSDPTCILSESVKKAEELFHQFILQKTLSGSVNTLLYFFISKNWFDMQDKTEVVHKSSSQVIDLDEQQRIINSTPGIIIDVDYKPISVDTPARLIETTQPEDYSADTEDLSGIFSGRLSEDYSEAVEDYSEEIEDFDDL